MLAMTDIDEYADLKVKNRTSVGGPTQDGKELHLRQNNLALIIAAPLLATTYVTPSATGTSIAFESVSNHQTSKLGLPLIYWE